MLRGDLQLAGVLYRLLGAVFDFHSQRHGAITRGSGTMNLRQLQAFTRHSKIELTMRSTHVNLNDLAAALAKSPSLPANKTGPGSLPNEGT